MSDSTLIRDNALIPVAVMFCDISGSTALYRAQGDQKAESMVRGTLNQLREVVTAHDGKVIKTIGDELMCRFATGPIAANAAIEMHRVVRGPGSGVTPSTALKLRIGFAYGQAVDREGDLFGDVVNVAARLAAMAKADQILTTEATVAEFDRDLRSNTRLFDKTPVKGIKEEISVIQVLWDKRNQTSIIAVQHSATTMALSLKVVYQGREMFFTQQDLPCVIGRGDDCNLIVPSETASRKHCRIEYNRGKFMLVDESSNGTYVEVPAPGQKAKQIVYLRNESFAMVGEGRFSLGKRPEKDPHVLTFKSG